MKISLHLVNFHHRRTGNSRLYAGEIHIILKEAEQQMCHYSEINLNKTFYKVPEEAEKLIEVLKKANIEAENIGFINNDISVDNIGKKKNGEFVFFDQHSGFSKRQIEKELNKVNKKKIKP